MGFVGFFEDAWIGLTSALAKGALLAVVPIAKTLNVDFDNVAIMKPELKSVLEKHGMRGFFEEGNVNCSCCGSKLTYNNLGGVKESTNSLSLSCDNPGCSIKL